MILVIFDVNTSKLFELMMEFLAGITTNNGSIIGDIRNSPSNSMLVKYSKAEEIEMGLKYTLVVSFNDAFRHITKLINRF